MKFQGENILVTGAAKRVGRAISLELARQGASVAVHYHSSNREAITLVKTIQQCRGPFRADLSRLANLKKLVRQVQGQLGPIHVLVNNAANFIRVLPEKIGEREWEASLNTNLKGPFFLALQIGLAMKKRGGVIINIADWAGIKPYRFYLPHSIAKAGVIAMTQGLAKVLGPKVRVYGIAPRHLTDFRRLARLVARMARARGFRSGATYSVDGKVLIG